MRAPGAQDARRASSSAVRSSTTWRPCSTRGSTATRVRGGTGVSHLAMVCGDGKRDVCSRPRERRPRETRPTVSPAHSRWWSATASPADTAVAGRPMWLFTSIMSCRYLRAGQTTWTTSPRRVKTAISASKIGRLGSPLGPRPGLESALACSVWGRHASYCGSEGYEFEPRRPPHSTHETARGAVPIVSTWGHIGTG